ncbi:MAG: electron transport complex subunit RsxC, partial [Firmicutes bacterium]|nr:electron transport complex subunit RsxC [Bacillota bacterium]
MGKIKGIYIPHHKNTAKFVPETIVTPPEVRLPMSMHSGTPATPIVAVGDYVKIGQLIGEATGRVSSPIHASVSGKIKSIDEFDPVTGEKAVSIVIETNPDEEQVICENITPPTVTNTAEFLNAVQNSGVVGLGGAGYPTAPKLTFKEDMVVDYILVNGAECEPYITSDTRIMIDDAESVFEGSLLMKKYLNTKNVVICIEDNKPEAIAKLQA